MHPVRMLVRFPSVLLALVVTVVLTQAELMAQGVTTGAMNGFVTDDTGRPLEGADLVAIHVPSGTRYRTVVRTGGAFTVPNMRVGGPYRVTVEMIGYQPRTEEDVRIQLGQTTRLDFQLQTRAIDVEGIEIDVLEGNVFNSDRTGAATFLDREAVTGTPTVDRSTRDLIKLDPRNDGNFSFAGRNWLYNNISLDGSYFSNPFGLDDPAPGGQTNAEPVPFDAVEQVQVSVAPFDVRQGGFTGAQVNTVTKSGTNEFRGSVYTFIRNEGLQGNQINGSDVIANPDLSFNQSGLTLSGPLIQDKLFFFVNAELSRRDDPGTDFVANSGGPVDFGEARVEESVMEQIRDRMISEYGYDPGPYQGFIHETNNNKFLAKLDWNLNPDNNLSLRYNYLDAEQDKPPHPFVLSPGGSGRGPNASSLPFRNSGYRMNNELHSFALELNSRGGTWANRFFASYNRFRDFRTPFSDPFPTVDIAENGVTYTTLGHEPFSIHNILDQDVLQIQDNLTFFKGPHSITVGSNFEWFGFFNSFNIFRHGVFFLPASIRGVGSTFFSLDDFFTATDPSNPDQIQFNSYVTPESQPFKGEDIDVGQLSFYAQDEWLASETFTLTFGARVDIPMYFTDPVANPFSTGLTALDENDDPETVDQADLPGASPLFSPRVGFNWDVSGDQTTQLRGGTGIFTGRIPFVWFGNVISNPGANPNLPPAEGAEIVETSDDAILQQSFDLNAMDPDFEWPQVWITDLAIDQMLPGDVIGTLELIYGNDMNSIFMRNADLRSPTGQLADGRPFFGEIEDGALVFGSWELNPDGNAGIYVIDNTNEGWNLNITAQLRKRFESGLDLSGAYSFTEARSQLKSTEIASVLWQEQPVRGDPNQPETSFSEFGQRHRIIGTAFYGIDWNENLATRFGVFFQAAEGNRFTAGGGNRYSFLYAGDVNGDGTGSNDLIFIPENQSQIRLEDPSQWAALNAFIEQDDYLSEHRGQIAERFGAVNPWYSQIDLKIVQDLAFQAAGQRQRLQLNVDILNVANLLNSDWGVRDVADPAATRPLELVRFDADGEPVFRFVGPEKTFIPDPNILSRWQIQVGAKYLFN